MDTFVVVGGDAAGMSAASKAKRDDPSLEVVVLERGEWVSYGACGLPYSVKGEIQSLEELVSVTPEQFHEGRDIDLRTGHDIVAIDPDARAVTADADGEPVHVPLALTVNRHGRAVGQTVTGDGTLAGGVAGTAAVKTFEVEAARTGILDHDEAEAAGFAPVSRTIDAKSRAGYYPAGGTVRVTLMADRTSGRLLGASLVSEYGEGAVHRSHPPSPRSRRASRSGRWRTTTWRTPRRSTPPGTRY